MVRRLDEDRNARRVGLPQITRKGSLMTIPRYLRWLVCPVLALLLLASAIWAAPTVTDAEELETGLDSIVAVVNEVCHSLVLRVDGTVWGWGCNSDWDLGATAPDGDDSTAIPLEATGLDQV